MIQTLLNDFRHHHIDMTCQLLETCGQFLYRSPDSHPMTKLLLEKMMRLNSRTALDARYTNMIENAFYQINPPEGKKVFRLRFYLVFHFIFC